MIVQNEVLVTENNIFHPNDIAIEINGKLVSTFAKCKNEFCMEINVVISFSRHLV